MKGEDFHGFYKFYTVARCVVFLFGKTIGYTAGWASKTAKAFPTLQVNVHDEGPTTPLKSHTSSQKFLKSEIS